MGKKIISYFEKRAITYQENSKRWPWNFFRQKEIQSVEKLLSPKKESSLIDLGCGSGFYSGYFKHKYSLRILGIDSSPAMIDQLMANGIEGKVSMVEELDFPGQFDNALAAGVFEFIEMPEQALRKINSLLPIGGKFVLLVPVSGPLGQLYRFHHLIQGCTTFIRSLAYYETLLTFYGFKKIKNEKPTLISRTICVEKIRENN